MSQSLSRRFAAGDSVLSGWITLPDPQLAEAVTRAGFPAVTLDLQHGLVDTAAAFRQIAAVRHAGGRVLARVPVNEWQTASRLLDAGADGVIAPMIESVEEARAFAAHAKYLPLGQRSWGPTRAVQLAQAEEGPDLTADDYRRRANGDTLAIVMIETGRALAAIDDILALPEIDGVFVGPSDLSLALSGGAAMGIDAPETVAAIEHVARRAAAAGKPACIYGASGAHARRYLDMGYRLVTLMSDIGYLAAGARAAIDEALRPVTPG